MLQKIEAEKENLSKGKEKSGSGMNPRLHAATYLDEEVLAERR